MRIRKRCPLFFSSALPNTSSSRLLTRCPTCFLVENENRRIGWSYITFSQTYKFLTVKSYPSRSSSLQSITKEIEGSSDIVENRESKVEDEEVIVELGKPTMRENKLRRESNFNRTDMTAKTMMTKQIYNRKNNSEEDNKTMYYSQGKRSDILIEGSRCTRNNGKSWRCKLISDAGYALCPYHLRQSKVRNINNIENCFKRVKNKKPRSRSRPPQPKDVPNYANQGEKLQNHESPTINITIDDNIFEHRISKVLFDLNEVPIDD